MYRVCVQSTYIQDFGYQNHIKLVYISIKYRFGFHTYHIFVSRYVDKEITQRLYDSLFIISTRHVPLNMRVCRSLFFGGFPFFFIVKRTP